MQNQNINLIDGIKTDDIELIIKKERTRRYKYLLKNFLRISIVIAVILITFFSNIILSRNTLVNNMGKPSFWEGMARLIVGKNKILSGENKDQINILLLGIGGGSHQGPYLADTIILASIKPSTKEMALLSIPRDLYVPIPNYGWRKINSANALGMANKGDGGDLSAKVVSDILEVPIHYWVRINFNMFQKLIDEIGGIEINVEKDFIDYQFPGPNYTYRPIEFKKGWQKMDGLRALEFARSRHGTNGEGSDFARNKRQQKILLAVKEKIEEKNWLASPKNILKIYNILAKNISSNLDFSEATSLAKLVLQIKENKINLLGLKTGPNELLESKVGPNGAYILMPKSNNFRLLAEVAHNLFEDKKINYSQNYASPLKKEITENTTTTATKVIILNGTWTKQLAKRYSDVIKELGFETIIGNAPDKEWKNTTIYAKNKLSPKLNELKEKTKAEIGEKLPTKLKNVFKENDVDFLIILGKNSI